mgnify:CR=1
AHPGLIQEISFLASAGTVLVAGLIWLATNSITKSYKNCLLYVKLI